MALKEVKTDEFEADVLGASGPILVDFWAPWCGPCRMVGPVLEQIAEETGFAIVKVNIDEEPTLAEKYGVTSIPNMKVFVDGEPVHEIVGAKPKPGMLKELANFL